MNVFVKESRKLEWKSIAVLGCLRERNQQASFDAVNGFYIPESKKLNNGAFSKKTHKSPDPSTVVTTFITRHKLN